MDAQYTQPAAETAEENQLSDTELEQVSGGGTGFQGPPAKDVEYLGGPDQAAPGTKVGFIGPGELNPEG